MKKSSTFNLEQDIYNEIEEYRKTYNLSSRNIALERMLLERRIMLSMRDIPNIKGNPIVKDIQKVNQNEEQTSIKSIFDSSLEESFNNMPEE